MNKYFKWLSLAFISVAVTGCATTQPSTYPGTTGVIVQVTPLSSSGKAGTIVGGLAGAAAGGYAATRTSNDKAKVNDTAAGLLVGAIVGNLAEHAFSTSNSQYVVKTVNDTVVTVEQPTDPSLQVGQRVVVTYPDNKPHLIADNTAPQQRMEVHHYHHYVDDDNND